METKKRKDPPSTLTKSEDGSIQQQQQQQQQEQQQQQQQRATSLARRMTASLPAWEIALYTASWIFGVAYSVYNVYLCSRRLHRRLDQRDLELGWLGQSIWRKDVSDTEWHVFSDIVLNSLPWLFLHVVGSQMLRKLNPQLLPTFVLLLSFIFMSKTVGTAGALYLCIQPAVFFFLVTATNSSKLCYVLSLSFMLAKEYGPLRSLQNYIMPIEEDFHPSYITTVSFAWINSRCLSYCLDRVWGEVPPGPSLLEDFVHLLSYCFYIPLVIMGPIVNYKEYHTGLHSDYVPLSSDRAISFALTLGRYLFWMAVCHAALHALYFNAIQVDMWSVCGIAFSMGQFFHMKYVVYYGIPRAFLISDGVTPPAATKCVSRIHLYSDMWRYFDNGLYLFMHKYYFRPFISLVGCGEGWLVRLASSCVTFVYVFLWHGLQTNVFVWSVLNFLGVTLEAFARLIGTWPTYANLERSLLSPRWRRRFYSLLGAPLNMMSILSQFYFLLGKEGGDLVAGRATSAWPIGTPVILFFMYCSAQFSFEMRNWDFRSQLLRKKTN